MRRLLHLACIVAAAELGVRPGVDGVLERVAALSREMTSAAPARRPVLLAELIRTRAELLALGRDDDRAATWLLDQAESTLQQAGADGAELSVLYGIPTSEQRKRMRDGALMAAELVERAAAAGEQSMSRLEAELFAARGDAARARESAQRVEPRLRVLADVELAYRAPLYRARTALVVAGTLESGSDEQRRAGRTVMNVLGEARGPSAEAEAQRLVLEATARLLAGEEDAAERFAELEPAAGGGMLGEQARLGQAAAARDSVAAREAVHRLRGAEEASLALDLLRAEVAARALTSAASAKSVPPREAFDLMEKAVLRSLRPGVDDAMRALAVEKAATAAAGVPVTDLGEGMRYARGARLVSEGGAEGVEILDRLAADELASTAVREAALWTLGTAGAPRARWEAAARALLRLARAPEASARRAEALGLAEALVRLPAERDDAVALGLQRDIIELFLARSGDDPRAGMLRSVYVANVARDEAALPALPADLSRILEHALVPPMQEKSRREVDERNALVIIRRSMTKADGRVRVEMGKAAIEWAERRAPGLVHGLRAALASALLEAGLAQEAVKVLGGIGPIEKASLADAERTAVRLTLGRALRSAGRPEEAFATLRQLADEMDHEPAVPGGPKRESSFWSAWAEMLEILSAQNTDGARSPTIRLQINRLKLIDPGLGGQAFRERISGVESRLK